MSQNEPDPARLVQAMRRSRWMLERFRVNRREMVRQYVGYHWSDEGTSEKVPVNLISLYTSIVGRNLIAKNPRAMLSTFQRAHKPVVSAMQDWTDIEIPRMKLKETLERIVIDALFSFGVCKVALATPADAAAMAWHLRAGSPYAARVDLDDFVFDANARDWSQVGFIGHRYRVPLRAVKEDKRYSKAREDLTASTDEPYNQQGDERINMLGRGYQDLNTEEFEDMVDLWEIYLPRHRLVYTLADGAMSGPETGPDMKPLLIQPWLGPECGPYHILGLLPVPGNIVPKGPLQDLFDLHEAANNAYRKMFRIVERIKEIMTYSGASAEDAARAVSANDGDSVRVDSIDKIKQIVFGGTTLNNVQMGAMHFKDLFSWAAGNLDIIGGLSPMSKTASQDKMLNENSAKSVADMQDRTIQFTSEVVKSLCWYWHHDPRNVMRSTHALEGMPEFSVDREVTPEMRAQIPFEDLRVEVDPYSLQHSTPQSRMAGLNQLVQTIIMPMMPILQQQGIVVDINAYLQKIAAYMNQPDLQEIVTYQEPPNPEAGVPGGSEPPRMPGQTERTYTRESVSGRTSQGNNLMVQNALKGIDSGGSPNGEMMP